MQFANNSLQFNLAYLPGFHCFSVWYWKWMWTTCVCVCTRNGIKCKFELSIESAIAFYFGRGFNANVILLLALKCKRTSNAVHRVSTCIIEISSWIVNCISVDSTLDTECLNSFLFGFPIQLPKLISLYHMNIFALLVISDNFNDDFYCNAKQFVFTIHIDSDWYMIFLLLFCMRGLRLSSTRIANLRLFFRFQWNLCLCFELRKNETFELKLQMLRFWFVTRLHRIKGETENYSNHIKSR